MVNNRILTLILIFGLWLGFMHAPTGNSTDNNKMVASNDAKFMTIALGTGGGLYEGNLSAYLLAPLDSSNFISLDAGTLLTGLQAARHHGNLDNVFVPQSSPLNVETWFMREHIKAYLITHAHLDHIAGLVLNSSIDKPSKPIIGLNKTVQDVEHHLLNWHVWPNFGDRGNSPYLSKYYYVTAPADTMIPIANTDMSVTALPLSHSLTTSTAFLIEHEGHYVVYAGDTGADELENSEHLTALWQKVVPLIQKKRLHAMFLEVAYPNEQPEEFLYGHMTPKWLMHSLSQLANLVDGSNPKQALQDLTVIVTSIKPSILENVNVNTTIANQLAELNDLGIQFVFATQGQRIIF